MNSSIIQEKSFRNILLEIFSFLDPHSLLITTKVCKVWNQISESEAIWKLIAQKKGLSDPSGYKEAVLKTEKMEKSLEIGQLRHLQTLENSEAVTSLYLTKGLLFSGHGKGKVAIWEEIQGNWTLVKTVQGPTEVTNIRYSAGKLYVQYRSNELKIFEKKGNEWIEKETQNIEDKAILECAAVGKYSVEPDGNRLEVLLGNESKIKFRINSEPNSYIWTVRFFSGKLFCGLINGKIIVLGP